MSFTNQANNSKNASKDLETYILRNSTESLGSGGKKGKALVAQASYNFDEMD